MNICNIDLVLYNNGIRTRLVTHKLRLDNSTKCHASTDAVLSNMTVRIDILSVLVLPSEKLV